MCTAKSFAAFSLEPVVLGDQALPQQGIGLRILDSVRMTPDLPERVRAVRQVAALNYPSVAGTIRESKVTEEFDEAMMYGVAVTYDYNVDGWDYTGDRYCYGAGHASDSHAKEVVARLPPGTVVDVYYNPRDPADSCLSRGIQGEDLSLWMFMMPFNVIMILGWTAVAMWRWSWESESGATAVRVDGPCIRLRLDDMRPIGLALLVAGGLSFVLIFIVFFLGGGFHPPLELMLGVWAFILAASVIALCWKARRIAAGAYDLVLDEEEQIISLPHGCGRKQRETMPIASVAGVTLEDRSKSDSDGVQHNYAVVLLLAPVRRETLVEWSDRARSFWRAGCASAWRSRKRQKPRQAKAALERMKK